MTTPEQKASGFEYKRDEDQKQAFDSSHFIGFPFAARFVLIMRPFKIVPSDFPHLVQ